VLLDLSRFALWLENELVMVLWVSQFFFLSASITNGAAVASQDHQMLNEIKSIPCAFFSLIIFSISANKYGGNRLILSA